MTAVGGTVRSRRGMVGLLGANILSLGGTRLSQLAIPWFVVSTTGSATQTGLVGFALMGPYVVAKGLGGPVIDRMGPRRVIVAAELSAAVTVVTIPVLQMAGLFHFGVLLGIVAALGALTGPADGAKAALVPVVATRAGVPLERVTGLYGMIERLATTVGAAGAGALVAWIGAIPALWVTAATFTAAAMIIALTAPRSDISSDDEPSGYLRRLAVGMGFIRDDRLLRSIYFMVAVTNLLDAAAFQVLLPVWAHETGAGPAVIGLLSAVLGGAAVVSSALAAAVGERMPRRLTYFVGFLVAGPPRFVILAIDAPLWSIIAVFLLAGFGGGFLNPILGAVIFERIPPHLVGRVSTMGSTIAWAGMPFGGLVGGGFVAAVGISGAWLLCGAAYLVATTLPGLQREWAEMDRAR